MEQIGIGLAGLGTVGAGVYKHLIQNRVLISERVGLELAVRRLAEWVPLVVVKSLSMTRR